jgi:hypothetical protein
MLLSDKKASMAVQLHPLVILNASEHFTRYGAVFAENGVVGGPRCNCAR